MRGQNVFRGLSVIVAFIAETEFGVVWWCARRGALEGRPGPCLLLTCHPQAPSCHSHSCLEAVMCFQPSHTCLDFCIPPCPQVALCLPGSQPS